MNASKPASPNLVPKAALRSCHTSPSIKTFLKFQPEAARFEDGTRLTLADDEQRREFYKLRSRENHETDFTYPRITYTISESDLMPPEPFDD